MNLFLWTYLCLTILDCSGKIMEIGKPREPRTSAGVILDILTNGILAFGVIYYGIRP